MTEVRRRESLASVSLVRYRCRSAERLGYSATAGEYARKAAFNKRTLLLYGPVTTASPFVYMPRCCRGVLSSPRRLCCSCASAASASAAAAAAAAADADATQLRWDPPHAVLWCADARLIRTTLGTCSYGPQPDIAYVFWTSAGSVWSDILASPTLFTKVVVTTTIRLRFDRHLTPIRL